MRPLWDFTWPKTPNDRLTNWVLRSVGNILVTSLFTKWGENDDNAITPNLVYIHMLSVAERGYFYPFTDFSLFEAKVG